MIQPGPPPRLPSRPPDYRAEEQDRDQPGPEEDVLPARAYYSPDGWFWWDGRFWRGVDGYTWWDGTRLWNLQPPPFWDGRHWWTRDHRMWFANVARRWRTVDAKWEHTGRRWRHYTDGVPLSYSIFFGDPLFGHFQDGRNHGLFIGEGHRPAYYVGEKAVLGE